MTVTYPNWFDPYIPAFAGRLGHLAGVPGVQALQVGAYTGDASTWLLSNILTGPGARLTDVDTWKGSDEPAHEALNWDSVWKIYLHRIQGQAVIPYRMTSDMFFANYRGAKFDFVYIDGDHHSEQVARDGDNGDAVLKVGGVLAFDDYLWSQGDGHEPRVAINAFLNANRHRYEVLAIDFQVWLKKLADK